MKGKKIDDLFRGGLASHKISAPSTAWDKIETQLPSKAKKGIYFWFSIAASIILVFTFGWVIISNQGSEDIANNNLTDNAEVEKKDVNITPEKPSEVQPKIITPIVQEPKNLVAKTDPATEDKKSNDIITKTPSVAITEQVVQLAEKQEAPAKQEIVRTFKEIELIKTNERLAPKFYVTESMVKRDLMIDFSFDMESLVSTHQTIAELPGKKKRFSLLNGLVSVAKGVNSGKIGLSEMRKSKNDFFNNDLKYGSSEGEEEDIDEDLDKDKANLDKQ